MANTAVTSVQAKINEQVEFAVKAATADSANATETFDITPAKRDGKVAIFIDNAATDQGSVTYSLAAGDFWAAGAALAGTVEQGKQVVLEVETAKYKKSGGTMALTVTPATGKILLTNHALKIGVLQLS